MTETTVKGLTIKNVRKMTKKEREAEGWDKTTTVIVLSNGTKLYASCDSEGNDAGTLFGQNPDGSYFSIHK